MACTPHPVADRYSQRRILQRGNVLDIFQIPNQHFFFTQFLCFNITISFRLATDSSQMTKFRKVVNNQESLPKRDRQSCSSFLFYSALSKLDQTYTPVSVKPYIFQGHYNKNALPHNPGGQKSNTKVSAGLCTLRTLQERILPGLLQLLVASGIRWLVCIIPVSASIFTPFSTSLCLLSLIKTVIIEIRSHLANPGYPLLQTLNSIAWHRTPQQINSYLFTPLEGQDVYIHF